MRACLICPAFSVTSGANTPRSFGKWQWVSLGGGIAFTDEGYPLDDFCDRLSAFAGGARRAGVPEPGDASVTMAGYLVTQVQDILEHDGSIAIINAAGRDAYARPI